MVRSFNKRLPTKSEWARAVAVFLIGAISLFYVVYASGCAGQFGHLQSFSEMSPRGQAAMVLGVYNDQYDLYVREASSADLSESRKEILRDKKKYLVELEPYVGMFADFAVKGEFVPADTEAVVMKLMDHLLGIK